jgi:predicted secreted hydrolase
MRAMLRTTGLLLAAVLLAAAGGDARVAPVYAPVTAGAGLAFPRDHGAHPAFRTEWWYVTGWVQTGDGKPMGFQVTFFRTRPDVDQANPSAFAARQVLFAHAALADPAVGRLLHDQRVARAGFGLAEASETDGRVVIDDWSLSRGGDDRWRTRAGGPDFALDLTFAPTQPPLLQGQGGFSRKGPASGQASYYYSLPQMAVSGTVTRGGKAQKVSGSAWLDREWSSTLLDPAAVGWDWAGINLPDGAALTAFQVRDAAGKPVWAGGSWRRADGRLTPLGPGDVTFRALRRWRSPRTSALYPVEQAITVRLPDGERTLTLKPLFDDQELDSRAGGGPVYWEGAVSDGTARGYLELTGYFEKLRL